MSRDQTTMRSWGGAATLGKSGGSIWYCSWRGHARLLIFAFDMTTRFLDDGAALTGSSGRHASDPLLGRACAVAPVERRGDGRVGRGKTKRVAGEEEGGSSGDWGVIERATGEEEGGTEAG